jgi:cyanophycinase
VHRASDESPVTGALLDSIFGNASGMATVLVARDGKVLIDRSYGVPDDPKYMPGTTVPNFPLRGLSAPINTLVAQLAVADGKLAAFDVTTMPVPAQVAKSVGATYAQYVTRRIFTPIGAHKTVVDSTGAFSSNVDELYRLELGLEHPRAFALPGAANPSRDESLGWNIDNSRGTRQLGSFGTTSGMRNAFIRIPAKRISIIILSNRDDLNARAAAERIADHFTSPE